MDSNIETANNFLNAMTSLEFDKLPSFLADDVEILGASGARYGKRELLMYFSDFENPFSEPRFEHIRTLSIGDTVVIESMMTGVQVKEYMGIPPSNKRFEIPTINVFDFEDGIIKVWKEYQNTKILLDLSNP